MPGKETIFVPILLFQGRFSLLPMPPAGLHLEKSEYVTPCPFQETKGPRPRLFGDGASLLAGLNGVRPLFAFQSFKGFPFALVDLCSYCPPPTVVRHLSSVFRSFLPEPAPLEAKALTGSSVFIRRLSSVTPSSAYPQEGFA